MIRRWEDDYKEKLQVVLADGRHFKAAGIFEGQGRRNSLDLAMKRRILPFRPCGMLSIEVKTSHYLRRQ